MAAIYRSFEQWGQSFTDTYYALKLYSRVFQDELNLGVELPFSDFCKPSVQQKQAEIIYVGFTLVASSESIIKMEKKLSRICHYPKGCWKGLAGVKELVQEAGVFEDVKKLLLMKQAI